MKIFIAVLFFWVGLFIGRFTVATAELFAVAGWIITGLFLAAVAIAFVILEKLRLLETSLIIKTITRVTNTQTDLSRMKDDAFIRHIKIITLMFGAITGALVSAIWSPDIIGMLMPF